MSSERKRLRAHCEGADPGEPACTSSGWADSKHAGSSGSSGSSTCPTPCHQHADQPQRHSDTANLLYLPSDTIFHMMSYLDSKSLVRMQVVCTAFSDRRLSGSIGSSHAHMSSLEKAARASMLRRYSGRPHEAERWRHYSWLQRMRIEETSSEFDCPRCGPFGFKFTHGPDNVLETLKLDGIGPKMLVSRDSTNTADFLHWRLELRGNNAVELGVVPEDMQDCHKALHKCLPSASNQRPTGMCSAITVGSLLPVRVPLMKGSDIEVLVWKNKLEFLISQPQDGLEMTWINSTTVPRPYTGPRQFRFEMDMSIQGPAKLALTCWAHAEFALLTSSSPRISALGHPPPPDLQQQQPAAAAVAAGQAAEQNGMPAVMPPALLALLPAEPAPVQEAAVQAVPFHGLPAA